MKNIFLFASIAFASGLLFVNLYTSLIDAKSWGSNIPQSIATARDYFKVVTPGDYFRKISPINQLLALLVLVLFWKTSVTVRICLGAALLLYVAGDLMTFAYFYPRNDIMFKTASLNDVDLLRKTWGEWTGMNWVRSFIILVGLGLSCYSLHRIYS